LNFQPRANKIKDDLLSFLIDQKRAGKRVAAYGAAAKAVTALYTLGLVNENLIGVVDDNELKQNCYFPGTDILITSPAEMDKTALVVITAWNVYDDIKRKLVERGHTGEILCLQ
jgi:hypothetical protein